MENLEQRVKENQEEKEGFNLFRGKLLVQLVIFLLSFQRVSLNIWE